MSAIICLEQQMIIMYLLVALFTFLFMEFVAWLTHKYVMHGFLWKWHQDHHEPHQDVFEKNDRFFLVFAIPSIILIFTGSIFDLGLNISIGIGIALYGLCYFLVHDVYIHRRLKWLRQINHPYFKALRKAHKVHHKNRYKEKGQCFGMLIVPFKYYKEAKN